MQLELIVAQTLNRVIGRDNQMPWHLPRDLAHFKEKTLGCPVIMGRRTFLSLGKALPHRKNLVLSRSKMVFEGATVCVDLEEALRLADGAPRVFVLGGAEVYRQALPLASALEVTWIQTELMGDTFFPEIDFSLWQEVSSVFCEKDEKNAYALRFVRYERRV